MDNTPKFSALTTLAKSLKLESRHKKRKQRVKYYDIYTPDVSDTEDVEQVLLYGNINGSPSANRALNEHNGIDSYVATPTSATKRIKRRRLNLTNDDDEYDF